MVSIIFSDLDNTLANKRYISENNINAINKYTSLGNLFVITSGRSVSYINKIAKSINNKRYIIGNNGSIIYDNKLFKLENIKIETLFNNIPQPDTVKNQNTRTIFYEQCNRFYNYILSLDYTNNIKYKYKI